MKGPRLLDAFAPHCELLPADAAFTPSRRLWHSHYAHLRVVAELWPCAVGNPILLKLARARDVTPLKGSQHAAALKRQAKKENHRSFET